MSEVRAPSGATVLVVDDNAINRQLISTLLKYQGHAICEAADGRDALRVAERMRPRAAQSVRVYPFFVSRRVRRSMRLA